MKVNFLVTVEMADLSPRELRRAFLVALRASVQRARQRGRIGVPEAEEFYRAIPDPERE